jgi:voltage-gated potassium channel
MERAVTSRRIFPYLVVTTACLAVLAGFLATVIDRKDFPNLGTGIWWAIVTLATVGYGDVVPHSGWGRVFGSAVIIIGVTFLSFLIAIVTSYFVSAGEQRKAEQETEERERELAAIQKTLHEIKQHLASLEAKIGA